MSEVEIDYFQDMEPAYKKPPIIRKSSPLTASGGASRPTPTRTFDLGADDLVFPPSLQSQKDQTAESQH